MLIKNCNSVVVMNDYKSIDNVMVDLYSEFYKLDFVHNIDQIDKYLVQTISLSELFMIYSIRHCLAYLHSMF